MLNHKQQLFVQEYLVDMNATKAALRSGYSKNTAHSIGCENLTKPEIKNAIDLALANQAKRTSITADRVLSEIARIAFLDIGLAFDESGELLPINKMPEDVRRALSGLEVEEIFEFQGKKKIHVGNLKKIKFNDKGRALEQLAKHFKLLTEKVEHSGIVHIEDKRSVEEIQKSIEDKREKLKALDG